MGQNLGLHLFHSATLHYINEALSTGMLLMNKSGIILLIVNK